MATRKYQHGSLTVRKRRMGPSVWQFRYSEDGRVKAQIIGTVLKYPTKFKAECEAEKIRSRINGKNPQQNALTVAILVDRFILEELPIERRFQTQAGYRCYLNRYIRPRWGEMLLEEIDAVEVEYWLDSLKKCPKKDYPDREEPLAPKTKREIRNAFRLIFHWARKRKMFEKENPIVLVKQKGRRRANPPVLTPDQFKALLAELKEPYRTMVLVAGCLGIKGQRDRWAEVGRYRLGKAAS